ncbi:hypothetical protein RMN57_14125 [Kitasatospora sp. CM 4170]|uniref:Uncharacterized protein n=1 Tax=Kitasatospora aburaviensis TaxID=67265 RepID=A0ABW1EVH1_9ACTN|nr:hypothetical protein [Kitasatospora sp. CM 4170]WNM45778.1 hypothetical protein RMN57_14125 [Kitasatospora sp. CM 4170]
MTEQTPYGAPPPPAGQPYGAPPVPPQQPGYGAVPPQAPPPGAPAGYPGYGAYAPVPQRKSRKTLWVLLGVFAVVLALIGGAVAYFVLDVTSNAGTQKIVLPTTFKDLRKDDDNEISREMEKEITSEFGKGDGAWNPTGVSAVYQDSDDTPQLIVVGGYGKVLLPKQEMDAMFKGFEQGGPTVSDRHAVDAGPKGGTMECAKATQSGTDLAVCAWADNSSLVMLMRAPEDGKAPDLDKLAAEARDLRAIAEVPK